MKRQPSDKSKRLSFHMSPNILSELDSLALESQPRVVAIDSAIRQIRLAFGGPVHGELNRRNIIFRLESDQVGVVAFDSLSYSTPSPLHPKPPVFPEALSRLSTCLSMLMSVQVRDAFIGDLEERYGVILKAKGRQAATIWFWRQVIHSFLSLVFDTLKRMSGLEKLYRRIGS